MSIGAKKRPQGTFDANLEFKDAGLVASSAAATVDSAAKIINLGTGLFRGEMIIDVAALEIASNTELYDIIVQGSSDADFGTDTNIVELAAINLSAAEVKRSDCNKDDATGRYKIYFDNENNGTHYPYARVYTVVGGDVATGINYSAYAVPME
ncbi:MAG: hypothetical protein AB7D37_10965 [Desulfovibrio sp.]